MAASATHDAPRLPGHPLLASHLRQWRRDPVKLVTDAARLGRVVRLDLPGRTFLVTDPADVKHVLQDNHQNYCKGWVFDRIKPYWGDSLLTADGDTWRRQRQAAGRARHRVSACGSIRRLCKHPGSTPLPRRGFAAPRW